MLNRSLCPILYAQRQVAIAGSGQLLSSYEMNGYVQGVRKLESMNPY